MKITQMQRRTTVAAPLVTFFREHIYIDKDPPDADYQQRYAKEMIDGFRLLSLLVFATTAALFLFYIMQTGVRAARPYEALSTVTCALLALAGGVGLLVSKSIRSPAAALLATAALLVASCAVLTIDRLQQFASGDRLAPSLIPIIFSTLMLGAAVLPLRPHRVLWLGVLLLASCGLAALFTNVPFQGDLIDFVGAGTVVAMSVVIAARSTSQRIRIHRAHTSDIEAERQAEEAHVRALLAESAVTIERLAASLSHELNTPIGALKSATETLARGVQKHASFPCGSRMPQVIEELSSVIKESIARLSDTVARIQRFANLDHSAVRLVDINQLVQDSVALINARPVNRTRVNLNLQPLPQICCRPHGLSVAIASILNTFLDSRLPATIDTYCEGTNIVVKVARAYAAPELQDQADLGFAVEGAHVRASGWDLVAARQLVRENGGELRLDGLEAGQQVVTITLPANTPLSGRDIQGAAVGVA
jgi:signal transduction histidine kinase